MARASYADIEALAEPLIGEIFDGRLVVTRRAPRVSHATSVLCAVITHLYRLRSGWVVVHWPELHLGSEWVVVPDVCAWRPESMPTIPAERFEAVPDWVCEVISPSTEARDRAEKMPFYARAGVGHAWLVDPIVRTLEVYRLERGAWVVAGVWHDAAVVRAEPFVELELNLALLWAPPPPAK